MGSHKLSPNPKAGELFSSIKLRANRSSSSSSSSLNPAIDRRSERFLLQNHGNFERSGIPSRVMFYRGGTWTDYPSRVVESLRSGFSGRKSVLDLAIEGSSYVFDFLRMLQIDTSTGHRRSIAWIDDAGHCFFPKEFEGGDEFDSAAVEIEIEIRVICDSERESGKRRREFGESKEENEVTSKRSCVREYSRWPNVVELLGDGDGGFARFRAAVSAEMRKVRPGAAITAIHRCTRVGPLEKARRAVFSNRAQMIKSARGTANVVRAWFSASRKGILGILAHGFGISNGDTVHLSPLGLPFTSDVRSEADENGERHLMLCAVILGRVEKVDSGSQQRYPSSPEFDSGADDPQNPKWYVVWPTNVSTDILPECVVSYKSYDSSLAREIPNTKYTFPQLFTKIKTSLSPFKVQECINLFAMLKSGAIAKDVFIKQFRAVAGEEVLLSAIREICGIA